MIYDISMTQNSLVTKDRMDSIVDKLEKVKNLDGFVCEVGVYKGGTSKLICSNTNSKVFLIDTFEGLPQESEHDNYCKKGFFNNPSTEHIVQLLNPLTNYEIIKQEFPKGDTSKLDNLKFKFIHLDVDIYESTKNCLEYFYPRMLIGGYIVIDDYNWFQCLGVNIAVNEFFSIRKEKPICEIPNQAFIIKEGEKC